MERRKCRNCGGLILVTPRLFGRDTIANAEDGTPHVCLTRERLRDEGIARAEAAQDRVDAKWRDRARLAVIKLANAGVEFNADDVYEIAGRPERPCAIGGVFKWARNMEPPLVRVVGERKAKRALAHARPAKVYMGIGARK